MDSEAAADSTGTTTRRPLITTTAHGPGTRRLRPNQWSKLDTQNRTTSGNRVTAHNAHELFIPLRAATFWAKLWLDRRKHLWSSRDAQPLPSTFESNDPSSATARKRTRSFCDSQGLHPIFETLRSRWSLHPFPTLLSLAPIPPRRSGNTPSLSSCFGLPCGPRGLAHVTPRPGPQSRDSPDSRHACFHGSRGPAPLPYPGTSPTAPSCRHARTSHASRLVSPHR